MIATKSGETYTSNRHEICCINHVFKNIVSVKYKHHMYVLSFNYDMLHYREHVQNYTDLATHSV